MVDQKIILKGKKNEVTAMLKNLIATYGENAKVVDIIQSMELKKC